MAPRIRKFALTAHVTASVGWLGAVVAYIALVAAGLTGHDDQTVRAAYRAMEALAWFAIIPFSLTSLLTGLVSSLGTVWGLFRHYWVVLKVVLTLVAIVVLLEYTKGLCQRAAMATKMAMGSADQAELTGPMQFLHPVGGLLVLLTATVLAMYEPRGLTPYGWRRQQEQRTRHEQSPALVP